MRYPLVLDINPSITREGPSVYLPPGDWEIEHDAVTCKFCIVLDPVGKKCAPDEKLPGETVVYVLVSEPGQDKSLTVYVRRCRST